MKSKSCVLLLAAVLGVGSACAMEPELLKFRNGGEVKSVADWETRRKEIASIILPIEYGRMPARPDSVRVEPVGETVYDKIPGLENANVRMYKVWTKMDDEDVTFVIKVWSPRVEKEKKEQKLPLLLEGDGCWSYLTDAVIRDVIGRGWMVAQFNRCEVARDNCSSVDSTLLKWAWTYHRAIDALIKADARVDASRIAITGHSRGGKTVLLAGATDPRIYAVGENCSGCGGSGPCRDVPKGGETIADITRMFPYWFAPDWAKWAGREHDLPFDQHFLESLIAPRRLFIRQAKEDFWANPEGGRRIYEAARPAWALYGKETNFVFSLREGVHCHRPDDFAAFLDFVAATEASR